MKKQFILIFILLTIQYVNVKSQKLIIDEFFKQCTYKYIQTDMKLNNSYNDRRFLFFFTDNNEYFNGDFYKNFKFNTGLYNNRYDTLFKGINTRIEYITYNDKKNRQLIQINHFDKNGLLKRMYKTKYYPKLTMEEYIFGPEINSICKYSNEFKSVQTYSSEFDTITQTGKEVKLYDNGDTAMISFWKRTFPKTSTSISYSKNKKGKQTSIYSSKLDEQNRIISYYYLNNSLNHYNSLTIDKKLQWKRYYKKCKRDSVLENYYVYTYNAQGQNEKITKYNKNGKIIKETLFDCNPLGIDTKSSSIEKQNICKNLISNADGTFYTLYLEETNNKNDESVYKVLTIYNADSILQQIKTYTRDNKIRDSLYLDSTHLYFKIYYSNKYCEEYKYYFNSERFLKMDKTYFYKGVVSNESFYEYFYDENGLLNKISNTYFHFHKNKPKKYMKTIDFVNDYY
ncbi:MAG: hypothetical protein A2X12_02450 [Bacteroidetes bacterium GWE2_29_8]|nr:MAG: hypothetical protein A2X12_02450 [Bacteroidetes bacterium GWE2_29_8]OFY14628.1 MAG: hypothetical protein A2X02_06040 [Bacteroidetes bacterium GWF2_29_10]